MANSRIFLIGQSEGELIPMDETSYTTEDILQLLVARYPDLLPGAQINPENPRRFLLVKREIGIPGDEGGSAIWSLDHLFLDQDGVPTFVECKRAVDTRTRREVVAQMLDYAANGIEYWGSDRLRQAATETAQLQNRALDEMIQELIGADEPDVEIFWQRVEQNLHNGKVRLIFVADTVPRELRRLVEFLQEKMSDVEVIAVEIKQFLSKDGHKAVVPRVVGPLKEDTTGHRIIIRDEFLANCDPTSAQFFRHVLDLADKRKNIITNWGTKGFALRVRLSKSDTIYSFAYGWPAGIFEFYFGMPLSDSEAIALRGDLLRFGIFEEAGRKTLRSKVNIETLDRLKEAYSFILDKINLIAEAH